MTWQTNPGSDDAIKHGCRCSPTLNGNGKGGLSSKETEKPIFFVNDHCKLHGIGIGAGYSIGPDEDFITCHKCQKTSYHPRDVSERYCGHCKAFHRNVEPEEKKDDTDDDEDRPAVP